MAPPYEFSLRAYKTMAVTVLAAMTSPTGLTQNRPTPPPFSVCSQNVNVLSLLPSPNTTGPPNPNEDGDTQYLNALIDMTEAGLVQKVPSASSMDLQSQVRLLGKLYIYDKTLSPPNNIACATCHAPYAGFTGGNSVFNATTVAQAGGIAVPNAVSPAPNARFGGRKPQSYGYASLAPVLHYNATQGDFYGGNFWDMRATGIRVANPAAEQAQGPPVNPLEMANPDTACVVWKISQGSYKSLVELIGGPQSFSITWPSNVASVCATPGPPSANDPLPVHLSAQDRGTSNATYDHLTLAVASYEGSSEVNAFSSKFDAFLAGSAQLSADEQRGFNLFNGKANCAQCHMSGNAMNSLNLAPADLQPLFTDFTSANIGLPKNLV
jgi:cytochrome c peroxidase